MTTPTYEPPPTDPRSRLRELLEDAVISPEIAELRLAILREEIPQALIQIDAVRSDDTAIAIKATIGLPGGTRHSGIAAADVDAERSWADQLAMVQAIAMAKALDGLGHTSDRALKHRPSRTMESEPAQSRPSRTTESEPAQPRRQSQAAPSEDDHLPEYSWNAFWQTVNSRNITREQVEQALGKSVQEVTPKEAVDALKAAGLYE